jgi:lipopolysaccharide export system permease protein
VIIIKYILKNHFLPLIFSLVTLIAVFLLQFLMKFADRLVGKGLSFWVITKLITFNMAWILVLVVPMAVLISTLMAFGGMAQNNEIAVLKASGVSLYRMVFPPFIASIIIAVLLILFNNHVYPDANHAARVLMSDINRQKPTLMLVPGVFSQDIQNYSILARNLDPITNELEDLTIYDYTDYTKKNIISAKKGKIYFSANNENLLMDLYDGEMHESQTSNSEEYKKLKFKRQTIAMDASQFMFQQSSPGGQRGDRELGAQHMLLIVDSLNVIGKKSFEQLNTTINRNLYIDTARVRSNRLRRQADFKNIAIRVENKIKSTQSIVKSNITRINTNNERINKYWVEIHKKYSIPTACIVFVLIGASLGTMTRRGGFGVAAGISLIFFLIYWAFLIGGEKLADRSLITPFWGMWSANIFLGILGIYLLIKTAKERVTLNLEFLQKIIPKFLRVKQQSNENY